MAATTSIGQRFTQLIQQLGLSKNAFAMSLDKTATVIQHLVDERNKPGYDLICKVFETYPNVSKDWLLLGDGPMLLNDANPPAEAAPVAAAPAVVPTEPIKPPAVASTPSFPAPLFAVAARPVAPVAPAVALVPAEAEPLITPAAVLPQMPPAVAAQPALKVAPAAPQPATVAELPAVAPSPTAAAVAPPAPDATYLTAALHAQHLQHQLALAEQRNQHLIEQQKLMQQMLDLLKRPA